MNAPLGSRRTGYVRPIAGEHLSRSLGDPDACFARLNGPARHERIGESKLDLFAGIAFWFLVGIAPALCVLAIIAVAK